MHSMGRLGLRHRAMEKKQPKIFSINIQIFISSFLAKAECQQPKFRWQIVRCKVDARSENRIWSLLCAIHEWRFWSIHSQNSMQLRPHVGNTAETRDPGPGTQDTSHDTTNCTFADITVFRCHSLANTRAAADGMAKRKEHQTKYSRNVKINNRAYPFATFK